MHLTKKQENILAGEEGKASKKAMEILVALGEIYNADKLIPIKNAHVSGVSVRTAGDAGLNFLEDLVEKGAKVSVPTTINPAGMDLKNWKELGAPKEMSKKQLRMVKAYEEMGATPICSCTPYLIGNNPSFGDHLAWAESSAVVYANSVLGARTNREGAPSALASAITGLTPLHGYHLDENRTGDVTIKPDSNLFKSDETFPYSVLGYWIGKKFPEATPIIENLRPTEDQKKALGAGLATSGAIALYHIPEVTAEAKRNPEICKGEEKVEFGKEELEEVVNELDQVSDTDIICIGCPHASKDEIKSIIENAGEKEIWLCLARNLKEKLDPEELQLLEKKNVRLVCDTCMVVAPLAEMGYEKIGVNSAKAAYYAPLLAGVKVHFAPLKELIR